MKTVPTLTSAIEHALHEGRNALVPVRVRLERLRSGAEPHVTWTIGDEKNLEAVKRMLTELDLLEKALS